MFIFLPMASPSPSSASSPQPSSPSSSPPSYAPSLACTSSTAIYILALLQFICSALCFWSDFGPVWSVHQDQPRGGVKQKNMQGERRKRTTLRDIGNLVAGRLFKLSPKFRSVAQLQGALVHSSWQMHKQ